MSATMPWVREGKGYRCVRPGPGHAYFESPNECPGCASDTTSMVFDDLDEPLSPAPSGCMSTVEIEQWFVATARAAAASASSLELTKKGARRVRIGWRDHGAIAKHRDNAIKAMRAAEAMAVRREYDELVNRRERRIVERQRGAAN